MRCPRLMFRQHYLSHMRLTIFKFKLGSFLLYPHLYTSSKKGHSEKMLAFILMICHQSYWHTLQSRRSIHQPLEKLRTNRGCAVRVSSHQCRADGVSVRRAAEDLLHAFYVNLQLLNSVSQSVCPFVARHKQILRMSELSRANNIHRSYKHELLALFSVVLTYTCSK